MGEMALPVLCFTLSSRSLACVSMERSGSRRASNSLSAVDPFLASGNGKRQQLPYLRAWIWLRSVHMVPSIDYEGIENSHCFFVETYGETGGIGRSDLQKRRQPDSACNEVQPKGRRVSTRDESTMFPEIPYCGGPEVRCIID